ncbi:MAG: hypothetical protein HQM13_13310 [SAR324 cluster bacterium]|nr:hypothetical protein [SAR324 cluster bacterium]
MNPVRLGDLKAILTLFLLGGLVSQFVIGCTATESENVNTAAIFAKMTVEAFGGNSKVSTELRVGGFSGTYLDLTSSDILTVTANGQTQSFSRNEDSLGEINYISTFNFDHAGTEFVIALERKGDAETLYSNVSLPETFEITHPLKNAVYRDDENLNLYWEPAGSGLEINIILQTECEQGGNRQSAHYERITTDQGHFTIPLSEASGELSLAGTCRTILKVSRLKKGSLDPNYGEGGSIVAKQTQSVNINILP